MERQRRVRASDPLLVNEGALVGDIEHGVDASDTDAEAHRCAQLHDLGIAVVCAHLIDELAADFGVRECKSFGELDRESLPVAERVDIVVLLDVGVFVFGDRWLRTRRRACVESNGAGVDLCDPHPGELSLASGEYSGVHGLAEVPGRGIQRWGELPHARLLGLGSLWEFDSCHWLTSVVDYTKAITAVPVTTGWPSRIRRTSQCARSSPSTVSSDVTVPVAMT
jgi:hypothetical protein